mgnify:CR=1 FL=1
MLWVPCATLCVCATLWFPCTTMGQLYKEYSSYLNYRLYNEYLTYLKCWHPDFLCRFYSGTCSELLKHYTVTLYMDLHICTVVSLLGHSEKSLRIYHRINAVIAKSCVAVYWKQLTACARMNSVLNLLIAQSKSNLSDWSDLLVVTSSDEWNSKLRD